MEMTVMKTWFRASIAVSMLVVAPAWGTAVNPNGGGNGGELNLQEVFDSLVGGSSTVEVFPSPGDQQKSGTWRIAGVSSTTTILIEIAGYRDINSFGIYDPADPASSQIELFSGGQGPGGSTELALTDDGAGRFNVLVNGSQAANFAGDRFGYYLKNNPNGTERTYFSQSRLNGGVDHVVAYRGEGEFISPQGSSNTIPWDSNTYALAWEDLPDKDGDGRPGDWDYQDFVVLAQNVSPVPVPTSVWLMGSALVLLVGIGRRTRRGHESQQMLTV